MGTDAGLRKKAIFGRAMMRESREKGAGMRYQDPFSLKSLLQSKSHMTAKDSLCHLI